MPRNDDGFGDDMGTRVGRPDGAQPAPHDASRGARGPSTNTEPVADGLEGSLVDGAAEGEAQRRVRDASENVNPMPAAGDERRVDDL